MRRLYRFRKSEEAATAVEAALVISAFMLLVFGLVQFAEIFWTWNTMMLALEEGGRYAMIYNPTNYPNFPNAPPAAVSCSATPATLANCAVAKANATLTTYPSLSVTVSCIGGCTGTPRDNDPSRGFHLQFRLAAVAALRTYHDDQGTHRPLELITRRYSQ